MRFISTIFLSLLISHVAAAQPPFTNEFRTDVDVLILLHSCYLNQVGGDHKVSYKREMDTAQYNQQDTAVLSFVHHFKSKKWISMDFNKDGKADLVFCGYIDNEAKIIAFLSKKEGYRIQEFDTPYDDDAIPLLSYRKKGRQIIIGFISPQQEEISVGEKLHADTLVCLNNRFTDYQLGRSQPPVDSIVIQYSVSVRPIRDRITLTSRDSCFFSTVEMRSQDSVWFRQLSLYRLTFSTDSIRNLLRYVNSIPFKKFKTEYSPVNIPLDGHHWLISVYYPDGTVKEIFDHMGAGPVALRELYELALAIMHSPQKEFIRKLN